MRTVCTIDRCAVLNAEFANSFHFATFDTNAYIQYATTPPNFISKNNTDDAGEVVALPHHPKIWTNFVEGPYRYGWT